MLTILTIRVRIFLILLITFIYWHPLGAQSPVFKHYTVEDGLPSSEVYSAFQDSKGYMWFATDAGVSRFNGYEFENFDASDGLTDNTVFLITEDHKGRIWFGTFNFQLSYYKDGAIYPYQHNKKIEQSISKEGAMRSFCVDPNENIWIGLGNEGLIKVTNNGEVHQLIAPNNKSQAEIKLLNINNNIVYGRIFGSKHLGRDIIARKPYSYGMNIQVYSFNKTSENDIQLQNSHKLEINWDYLTGSGNIDADTHNDQILLIVKDQLLFFNKNSNSQSIKPNKMNIPMLTTNRLYDMMVYGEYLYLTIEKNGVYKYKIENDRLILNDHFLKNTTVSRVFIDKEKGLWFMTIQEGVYYLSNECIKNTSMKETSIAIIETDSTTGQLYVACDNGDIKKALNSTQFETLSKLSTVPEALTYNYYDNSLLIGGAHDLQYYKNNKLEAITPVKNRASKCFLIDSNIIYRAHGDGISIIEGYRETYDSFEEGSPKTWVTSLLKVGKKKLWLGTKDGIRIYHKGEISNPFPENKYLSSAITCLEWLNKDLFLVGTKSYGILLIKRDSIISVIDESKNLVGNLIKAIHIDHQKTVWVGTNSGLSKITFDQDNDYTVYNLTKKHGLVSAEITDITSYKNTIYAATPSGLMTFDRTTITPNATPPPIYFTKFTVNSETRKITENMTFSYDENFIVIDFEGINYRSLGEVQYQYRMLGIDTNWISTTSRSIQFQTLQPNDYTFEVKARNEDGVWSQPVTVSFTINPPFWSTWWFILLEILTGIAIIISVFRFREKQIRQRTTAEKRMVELELKALRSQMNPHFIFNTLNSIQHYIATNDFKNTNKYLTQFARLIRTVLHISEKTMITIQEEIDVLTMYMDLEKMRFDEQFEYTIEVGKDIDKDYDEIPSMLLQPYIENAIWHGLMNKKEKGKIKISIHQEGDYLCCAVEDNGIGRKKAAEITSKRNIKQKSVGMSITKERLDIINNYQVETETIDLYDDENPIGTKIIIKIPYQN